MTLSHLKENNNYIILTNKKSNEIEGNKEILILMYVKGQSNEIFHPKFLFHHSNQPRPLTNVLKYFQIWFRFRGDIQNLL